MMWNVLAAVPIWKVKGSLIIVVTFSICLVQPIGDHLLSLFEAGVVGDPKLGEGSGDCSFWTECAGLFVHDGALDAV